MTAKTDDSRPDANPTSSSPDTSNPNSALIRKLNDRLRKTGCGGQVLVTDGILAQGLGFAQKALSAIIHFDGFNAENDPWAEHDCASLTVEGHSIMFKIDYYDRTLSQYSPNPADPKLTSRVLTIMMAGDY